MKRMSPDGSTPDGDATMTPSEEDKNPADNLDDAIKNTEDRDVGKPLLLIVPTDSASDNAHRLLDRAREDYGYGVEKEYSNQWQAVYSLTPGFESEDSNETG